jgi:hypothetical protein
MKTIETKKLIFEVLSNQENGCYFLITQRPSFTYLVDGLLNIAADIFAFSSS